MECQFKYMKVRQTKDKKIKLGSNLPQHCRKKMTALELINNDNKLFYSRFKVIWNSLKSLFVDIRH
jgi:hypothetical protein